MDAVLHGPRIRRVLSATLAMAVLGKLAALAMSVVLGRVLGVSAFGAFVFAQGAGLLAARFAALGWPPLMSRLIPVYQDAGDAAHLAGLLRLGPWVVLAGGGVIGGLLAVLAIALQADASDPTLSGGLLLAALLCPVYAYRQLRRQQLSAIRRPALAMALDEVVPPLAVLALVAALAAGMLVPTASQAIMAYALGSLAGALAVTVVLHKSLRDWMQRHASPPPAPRYDLARWVRIGLLCLSGISAQLLLNKADVLMLAPLGDLTETGLYGAAFRLTALMTFPQLALALVMNPRFASAHGQAQDQRLRRELGRALLFSGCTTAVAAMGLLVAPAAILGLVFGPGFEAAAPVLIVLVLAQGLMALAFPLSGAGLMTGREARLGAVTWVALALNLCLNALLIPSLGALGAALATLAACAVLLAGCVLGVGWPIFRAGQRG